MKRRTQILIIILVATTVIYSLSVGYIGFFTKNQAIVDAKQITRTYAAEYANKIKADLESDLGLCRAMATSMNTVMHLPLADQMKVYNRTLKEVFVKYDYLSVSNSWELNAFVPDYTKTHGRVRAEFYEFGGDVMLEIDSMDLERDNVNSLYYGVKLRNQEVITEPYWYTLDERMDQILVTSIAAPVNVDGNFAGLAGVDRSLMSFQDTLAKIKPFDESFAYLVSHDGSFISHPNTDYLGKTYGNVNPEINKEYGIEEKIREGKAFSVMLTDESDDEQQFISYAPFSIGKTGRKWSIAISVPYDVIVKDANENLTTAIIIGVIGLLLLSILFLFVSSRIATVLVDISDRLGNLARGNIEETNKMSVITEGDELGRIKTSVNQLIDGLNKTVTFAVNIGKGNLDASYEKLSDEDAFGEALLNMRDSLRQVRKEEKEREEENQRRNWIAEGIAKVNDILRIYRNKETEEFAYQIVSNVVDSLQANQAGLFFVEETDDNDEGTVIDLKAAYAFNRRKLYDKQIKPGVGLVGRSVKEKRTIYLTEIPDHYLEITSGIGNSNPRNILIVPLISEDYVYGVIELASFKFFKEYEREFIARASEIIASAIATQRYSSRTSQLLRESNKKSEELAKQEQEMRNNLTELRAAQEESERAELEMTGIVEAVTSISSIIHLDPSGKIEKVMPSKIENSRVYGRKSVGAYISELDISAIEEPDAYHELWDNLYKAKVQEKVLKIDIHEDKRWIHEVYTPITDASGNVARIIIVQTDITPRKQQENRLKQQAEVLKQKENKLKRSIESLSESQKELLNKNRYIEKITQIVDKAFMRAEFTPEGLVNESNDNFARALGGSLRNLENQSVFDIANIQGEVEMDTIMSQLKSGVTHHGEFKFSFNTGEESWFLSTFSPGFDNENNLVRIYYLGYDITESKKMELRVREQSSRLKQQEQKLQSQLAEMKQSQQLVLQKNARIRSITDALDKSFVRAEFAYDEQLLDANYNLLNILGYSPSDIRNLTAKQLLTEEGYKKHRNMLKRVKQREVIQDEVEMTGKNKYSVWMLYTLAPQEDNKGNITSFIFIGFDISDTKQMQHEIQMQNKELKDQEEAMRTHLEHLHAQMSELEGDLERKEEEIKRLRKQS